MPAKILVVDDSASDRLIIKNRLKEYEVMTASDGLEAMRQMDQNEDIDLVILDLNMPNMNGFQVLDAMKSDDRYKKMRTIILTNFDELENEIKGLKLGAVDYIRKPIQMDSLKARIEVHIELLRVQKLLENKLYEQGLTFDTIFHQAPIGIAIAYSNEPMGTGRNDTVRINPMFEQITGRTKEELLKLGWAQMTHPDDIEEDIKNYEKLRSGEIESYAMDKRYIKPDGSIVWVHMVVAPLTLSNSKKHNHICLIQDISKRKAIENDLIESERSKSVLISNLPGLAYRCNYDREYTMQFVSEGCYDLTGYRPESLINNKELSFNDLISPEYREPLWKEWEKALGKRLPFNYEYQIITAKKERKWVLEMGQGIYNRQGEVEALEGIILDISDRKKVEEDLRYSSEHDRWTGLYNRSYLELLLKKDVKKKNAAKRALVNINLDSVQALTSTYGFHYTQDLIKKISAELKSFCSAQRLLFNTSENRFVFYLKDYKGKDELVKFCEAIANTLEPLLIVERINSGIGVVEINQVNEHDVDELLKKLLVASERAIEIQHREVGICFYDAEIEMQMFREQEIKHELAQIEAEEDCSWLFLQYQPILDLKSNQICGFEALARLNSNQLGVVSPLEFIPIAEETKLIIPLGDKIIIKALNFLNKLRDNGYDLLTVSINISAIQLLRLDFRDKLFVKINEAQVRPEKISLEITESVFTSNYEEVNRVLGDLKDSKINIAIDDFGTGYSSLARARGLKVNCLKIDKSFIGSLMDLNTGDAIAGDIISMAHKMGHCVIAEGVEHDKQKQYLQSSGCDRMQGYLISKPLDEEAAIKFLKKNDY